MWCFFVFWAAQTKSNPLHCVVGVGGNGKSRYPKSCCLNLRLSARLGSTASSRERCFFLLFGWIDPLTYTYIHTYIYTDTRGLKSAYFHMVCWDFHLDERLGGMFFLVHSDMSRGADCKHRTSRSGLFPCSQRLYKPLHLDRLLTWTTSKVQAAPASVWECPTYICMRINCTSLFQKSTEASG